MPPVSPFRRMRTTASEYRRARPAALNFEDLLRPQVEYLYRRPWLARVLYHQYVDSVRQRARSPVVELVTDESEDSPLDALPETKDGPEERAERSGQRERILRALDRLNPEQRAVVAMHDVEGYTLEELEKVLETPLGTLKSRLHRARQRLRALLPMEPFSPGERVKE